MRRIVPLLSALVLASSLAPAGPVRGEPTLVEVRVAPDGTRRTNVVRAGAHAGVIETRDRGRLVRTRIVDPAEAVRCIVAFRSLPAQLALRHGLRATQAQTDVEHLRADLATMTAAPRRAGALTASAVITAEYTEVFAGAAVTLSPSLLARVRSLAYVSGVFPDDTVRATLAQSVPLIGADSVRAQLGADGTGIRVGIIDTGIDYAHAAFGANGVGPGHKIAWGHDYTTDGNDGSDNFGHGTHVAGIVAGDGGGVVGVAPGASLYSFKVLNAAGYGLTSWILAAFDAVLDPDGDPGTDDGMQVVNMSFGAPGGTSNDPLAVAVDHLTELGVACAVAAGNDGVWMSIGSPGTSRRAITVGATTKADAMTWFSSRGPVSNDFDLKPDVCAPGADIVSSAMGGGTVSLSGTSMATPHIAGVAALLRQRHPDWSADAVKGAIVGTALDIGAGELEQGSGRVLAMRAAQAKFVTSPTHLAFGMCDPSLPVWAASETLTVTNLTETATTVTWPDSVVLATGAVVRVSPSSAPLPARGTATAVATLRVDNAVAPYPAQLPYAHTATLDVHAAGETHRVPASFHKAATLTVASSGWIYQLNVIEHASGQLVYSDFGGGPILLPPGDYDVMASFFPDWVFVTHENVHVSGATLETLDPTEATVTVTWDNVDAAGQPVTCTESKFTYGFGAGTGMNFVGFTVPSLSSNPTLPGCGLQWEQAATDAQNFRIVFNGTVTSFDHSRLLTNAPSDLHHMPIDFPATAHDSTTMMFFPLEDDGMGGWMGFGFLYNGLGHHGAWTLDEWVTAPPTVGHYSLGQWIELYGYAAGGAPDLMVDWPTLYTAYVMYDHGWPFQLLGTGHPFETFGTFGGDRMRLGTGMPVWRGRFHNTPGSIEFDQHPEVNLLHAEYDAYATWLPVPDPQYEVMQGGTTIDAGTLTGMGDLTTFGPYSVGLPTAAATDVVVTREYTLRGRAATLRVDAHALVGEGDPDPPVLQAMQLLANGTVADSVDFATAPGASLHFRFGDDVALASVAASVRPTGSATWQALTPVTNGADRTVTLPSSLAGPVDVRLEALDATGNSIALTWSPGFVARPGSATEVEDDAPVAPQAFSLAGAIRNPARGDALAIAFTLPDAAPARLALYDLSGREVRAFDVGSRGAGAHVAELGHGSPLASGVYFARLTRDGRSLTRKVCVL